jgi:peptide deformylase
MIREIVTYPNADIRELSATVRRINGPETMQLIEDMKETMLAYKGVGLAAPQVGVRKRIIIAEFDGILALINPKYKVLDGETFKSVEGCLSVPGPTAVITRFNNIEVTGKEPHFWNDEVVTSDFKWIFTGEEAAIIQHEIDHLEGSLFFDHLKPMAKNMYIRKMNKQIKRGQAWRYQVATSL